jgi:hypothetical protein
MGSSWRLRALAGVLVLAAGLGCNPLTTVYFMMVGVENKSAPECKLASADKNKEVRVVLLVYSSPEVQAEQVGLDRQIGAEFCRQLEALCKANKERVKVVPFHKVEKFKSDHPKWQSMGPEEIGKAFDADYVIDVSVLALNLYRPGSRKALFEGSCKLHVSALEVRKAQDGPAWQQPLSIAYPSSRGPIPVGDDSAESFRELFVRRIATELTWKFTSHTSNESYQCD